MTDTYLKAGSRHRPVNPAGLVSDGPLGPVSESVVQPWLLGETSEPFPVRVVLSQSPRLGWFYYFIWTDVQTPPVTGEAVFAD